MVKHMKKQQLKYYIFTVLSIIAGICLDQYTKYLAVTHLKERPSIVIIRNVFELSYLENKGSCIWYYAESAMVFYCKLCIYYRYYFMDLYQITCFRKIPSPSCLQRIDRNGSNRQSGRPRETWICHRFLLFFVDRFSNI